MTTVAASLWALTVVALLVIGKVIRDRERRAWKHLTGKTESVRVTDRQASASLVIADVIARLKAGAAVNTAWRGALEDWGIDVTEPVTDDEGVPRELEHPDLRASAASVAAACRLTHQIGAPLAEILESVLDTIDETEAAQRSRAVARAGPELTARLLTALPLVGVLAATGFGIDVLELWMSGGPATFAAVIGVALWVAGHTWSNRLIRQASASAYQTVDPAVMLDLLVASLRAGASIPRSLQALGKACKEPAFERCATLLCVGAPFEALEKQCETSQQLDLIAALKPAWTFGASPTPLLRLSGTRIRASRSTKAQEEAERLAIRLVIPLGICLLPAFVAIGVVPIISTITLPTL